MQHIHKYSYIESERPALLGLLSGGFGHEDIKGTAAVFWLPDAVYLEAQFEGLPGSEVFGFHIHDGVICTAENGFSDAGSHLDLCEDGVWCGRHPYHAGDLPPIFSDEDGTAALYQSPEFINGRIAGVLEWGSSVGKYEMSLSEGKLESGPLLSDENGNNTGWMIKPSLLYAISANTKYPDEAAEFLDFILNDGEAAKLLGTSRGIPASKTAEKSLEESGLLTGLAQENDELLEQLDTMTISPYMELAEMKGFYNTAIEKISYNAVDTADAAREMYVSITDYLERMRK